MLTVRRIDAGSHGAWLSLVVTLWLCAPLSNVEESVDFVHQPRSV
jgi:hypothetical protein